MNIIVCVKAVPNPALPVEFDVEHNSMKETGWNYILNPYDEVAMEEAMRLKEKHGGTVTAVTLGAERSDEILRACVAMGADEAVRIAIPDSFRPEGYTTAAILAAAVRQYKYDIVLCGYRSIDRNGGEVGSMLAEFLSLPVVTAIVEMNIEPDAGTATVSRRLERGAREIKRCHLPALFTTDIMLNAPRYLTLLGRKSAARHVIKTINGESLPGGKEILAPENQLAQTAAITRPPPKKIYIPTGNLSPAERIRMLTMGSAARKSSSNVLEGNARDIVPKIAAFLKEKRFLP
jgi:electron transfer flavoprotein beta subunit